MSQPSSAKTGVYGTILCLVVAAIAAVQARPQTLPAEITNATVVDLATAGVAPDTIALIVRASVSNFDLSQTGLDALRRRGVADAVIAAMLRSAVRTPTRSAPGAVVKEISFALERHDATDVSLAAMTAAPYTSALSYGLFSAGTKVIVPSEGIPTFRVELPPGRKPTDFILSKFEESDEGGPRQINPESSVLFDADPVADGVYRLRPREALRRGEYGFYIADPEPQVRMATYDFRIVRR